MWSCIGLGSASCMCAFFSLCELDGGCLQSKFFPAGIRRHVSSVSTIRCLQMCMQHTRFKIHNIDYINAVKAQVGFFGPPTIIL